ncbi:MAG TPA: glycosyltransferase family 4 protein [Micromonosporaceae bacterium]|nr:glycosyltransferase family 4 protein [Micromonosporaceae bacterium]
MRGRSIEVSTLSIGIVSASDVAGGAETHCVALASGLRRRGHEVVLYGRCPGWDEAGLPRQPVELGPKWSRRTLAGGLLRVPMERHAMRGLPQRSLFHLQFKREQLALTRSLSRRAPVVWTEHGRWMDGVVGRLLLHGYARASRHVAKVVCVSGAVADDIRDAVGADKVAVVPNAIDTARYAVTPARRARARETLLPPRLRDRTVAVLAARLHPDKRHDRAVIIALATGTPLIVIGDGPDRARLQHLADGRPDTLFVGHRDDVAEWLAAADLYVYCGTQTAEGTPYAVLEAAASGLPIVGFRGDSGSDLVEHCGGAVVSGPSEVTGDLIAALVLRRGTGVGYVSREHGLEAWVDAYERIFRECTA